MSIAQNCGKCKQPICTCEDFEVRLDGTPVVYKACILCGKHYDRCRCKDPEFSLRLLGMWRPDLKLSVNMVCICDDNPNQCSVHTRHEPQR